MNDYLNTAVEELRSNGFLSEETRSKLTPVEYGIVQQRAQEEN